MSQQTKKKNKEEKNNHTIKILLLLILILLLLLLRQCGSGTKNNSISSGSNTVQNLVIDTNATDQEEVKTNPLADRQVHFAGIVDSTISKESKIKLENLPQNEDFLMQYKIYNAETGELLYQTDLIPSGKHVYWVPGEVLDAGEHNLTFHAQPYYPKDDGSYLPLTAGANKVTFIIV